MSNRVVGVVEEIKPFSANGRTMYSIKVSGNMYGTGSVEPKAGRGDTVAFEWTENGKYKNANMKTFSVEAGAPPAAPALSRPEGGGRGNTQVVIERQSALNSAIAFLSILQAAGAVPGITAKTATEDKYSILVALLSETASEFHAASTSGRAPGTGEAPDSSTSPADEAETKAAGDKPWQ